MAFRLLIINPGSTSTKIGVYEDEKQIFENIKKIQIVKLLDM